ncbi:hypothetical protein D3C84_1167060 [compost metagenome]
MCVERSAVHAMVILVGRENAGHLGAVTDPVEGADLVLDIIEARIPDSSLKGRQAAVQAGVDQSDGHPLAGAAAGIKG